MTRLFAVIRSRQPRWDDTKSIEAQPDWSAHAAFMDGLFEEGTVLLAGPLEGTRDVLLIVRAAEASEIAARLGTDPWTKNGLLADKQITPWRLRLGSFGGSAPERRG